MIRLLTGDCRAMLATLPEGRAHCVVTSPPFWGLRAYGTEPQVWGASDAACEHEWGGPLPGKRSRWGDLSSLSAKQASNGGSEAMVAALEAPAGSLCARCGAWRGELGLEPTPELFCAHLVEVFRAVWRVLRDDGTCWVNLGDSYAGSGKGRDRDGTPNTNSDKQASNRGTMAGTLYAHNVGVNPRSHAPSGLKPKDLCGIPWRVAFALQADGWYLRSDVIWSKPNPMPESITDRPTKAHEYLFLLAKRERYFYDADAIREPQSETTLQRFSEDGPPRRVGVKQATVPSEGMNRANGSFSTANAILPNGRNKRSVWTIPSHAFPEAHFATYPPDLVDPCIKAGTSERGACAKCGAPWRRVVEKGEQDLEWQRASGGDAEGEYHGAAVKDYGGTGAEDPSAVKARILAGMRERRTTEWRPSCSCGAEVVPCVVLDPFGGAGTTALVADRLGRDAILCELNPEYAAIARRRLQQDAPLFAEFAP
jgi:DNA modification methylase